MQYVLYGFGYVTGAAEYGQDILIMGLNISSLQNERRFDNTLSVDYLTKIIITHNADIFYDPL
ncbi:MAG TPA: hypothetical protein VKA91_05930 [Nitrososphaeraceae archaeon]|jgi:hypothetical protein|nr:hypothetical protein [Nitrososphaeraceae archaeon]